MEIDLSNAKKADQITWSSGDPDLFGHARGYICSFCKRGFSNAQALGGHMNIHRKDRAKLKEFAGPDNNIFSLDVTERDASAPSPNPNPPPPSVDYHDTLFQLEVSGDERISPPTRASTSPDHQEIYHDSSANDQLQLSLFTETSSSNNKKAESNPFDRQVETSLQLSHSESFKELDLELRLGPEPRQASKRG